MVCPQQAAGCLLPRQTLAHNRFTIGRCTSRSRPAVAQQHDRASTRKQPPAPATAQIHAFLSSEGHFFHANGERPLLHELETCRAGGGGLHVLLLLRTPCSAAWWAWCGVATRSSITISRFNCCLTPEHNHQHYVDDTAPTAMLAALCVMRCA